MNDMARAAIELRDLVERFASLSEGAMRACATSDTAVLAATLDARDLLLSRANAAASQLMNRRRQLTTVQRASLEELLHPVRRAADHAASVNVRLHARADAIRHELGRELDQVRVESDAVSAYTVPGPTGPRASLDTVR